MDTHQTVWNEKVAKDIMSHLVKRRMEASYAATADRAREEILAMIPKGTTVFRCGSMTAGGMGLWEAIPKLPGVKLIDPYRPELSREEGLEQRRLGMTADVMIASVNAITLDGKLVNLDGMGNRVAAMAFGPRKVILVVGMNKVEVFTWKPVISCSSFFPPHFGHFAFPASCSLMLSMAVNLFLHFGHR